MADQDLKLIQEQPDGSLKEVTLANVAPVARAQLGVVIQLDVTLANTATNAVVAIGPAWAVTTDDEVVFLPAGSVAPADNANFTEVGATVPSATETVEGKLEIATQSEADLAVATDKAMVPSVMRIRRDANGAVSIGDLGGNARGDNAINIQAIRDNVAKVASGLESVAIGSHSTASGNYGYATAVGYNTTASGYYGYATAIGGNATASDYSSAIGYNAAATGFASTAIGDLSAASGGFCTAIGFKSGGGGDNSAAIGTRVKTTVNNTAEIGYWSGGSTRAGAIRVHGTGMVAHTFQDRATEYDASAAANGSEADNSLATGMWAIRANGNAVVLDINIGGVVKNIPLGTAS